MTASRAVVFAGPSLERGRAERILPWAEFRAPIRRGDLEPLVGDPPEVVGIVDGLLFQAFAVSPKEVLALLRAGSVVYGASSIGALRAVELEPFGMRGVGEVFRMYRSGRIDGDDEVAMAYTADGTRALSDAMVSIRHGLGIACRRGVLRSDEARLLTRIAKRIYFPDRTWRRVLTTARGRVADETLDALGRFLERERPDVKRDDAIALLETVASRPPLSASDALPGRRSTVNHAASVSSAARGSNTGDCTSASM